VRKKEGSYEGRKREKGREKKRKEKKETLSFLMPLCQLFL
jgi:hypothetical protein